MMKQQASQLNPLVGLKDIKNKYKLNLNYHDTKRKPNINTTLPSAINNKTRNNSSIYIRNHSSKNLILPDHDFVNIDRSPDLNSLSRIPLKKHMDIAQTYNVIKNSHMSELKQNKTGVDLDHEIQK